MGNMSKITIWNMALGWVGTRTVAGESENTHEVVQCRLFWDSARRQALRDYPWNFARRRTWLAAVPMPEGYEREFRFAYALPSDCLKCKRAFPGGAVGRSRTGEEASRFIIAHDHGHGRTVLLTNAENALLEYTADITDATLFDDLFAALLARKLAALIAVPLLKNNAQKVQELEQLYRAAIPGGVEADSSEGAEAEKPDAWILSRGGGR